MAIEIKGHKKTIVFGYHDVILGTKVSGNQGFLRLAHYPDGIKTKGGTVRLDDEEFFRLEGLSNLRFDTVESLDLLLEELKNLKSEMLFNKLDEILKDVRSRTEFPTEQ